jgi:hypothetical protein
MERAVVQGVPPAVSKVNVFSPVPAPPNDRSRVASSFQRITFIKPSDRRCRPTNLPVLSRSTSKMLSSTVLSVARTP